jgi:hypothetical protein
MAECCNRKAHKEREEKNEQRAPPHTFVNDGGNKRLGHSDAANRMQKKRHNPVTLPGTDAGSAHSRVMRCDP